MTIDQLGRDLASVIEATAPTGPLVLIGHSMGGMTIMALADQHPELFDDRVIGVALVATSPGKLAEVGLGVPGAAGRALFKVAPRALNALNRRPEVVTRGLSLGADLQFVLTKRYSFATDVPPSFTRFVAKMHAGTALDVIAQLMPGLHGARQARRAARAQRRRDADPRRREGPADPRRSQPRHRRGRCRAPSW